MSDTYANGHDALSSKGWQDSTTANDRDELPFFPPQVAMYLVKLACELPDEQGRSLSQCDCTELARQLEPIRKILRSRSRSNNPEIQDWMKFTYCLCHGYKS